MYAHRIVIPQALKAELLAELHSAHMGVVKRKAITRSFIWWPNIDTDIENVIKKLYAFPRKRE